MRKIWCVRILVIASLVLTQISLVTGVFAEPATFNDPNFKVVWERTDKPVEMFVTQRSYMWGPNTLPGSPSTEPYADSPGGQRTVQYFDKSRMEVNNPNGDRSQLFFVTNGLLVREMVSGNRQFGDTSFQAFPSALEAVAGDPASAGNGSSPTYTTFKPIASLNNDNPSTDKTGQPVVQAIDKAGDISTITSPDPSVVSAQFDSTLKHNIANKFVDFLNQTGPIFVNGQIEQNQLVINGVFLAGLPITEAYWVKAKVAGVEKDVLVQLYERRVLTYTPSNPTGFQVEMGNVGQHYFRWRYGTTPTPPASEERIVFHSDRAGGIFQIYSMKTDGTDVRQLTNTMQNNFQPRWSFDNQRIVFQSRRDGNPEIYSMNADGSNQKRLTNTPNLGEFLPDWSADGTRIFFERERAAGLNLFDIWSMAADGSDQKQLTNTPGLSNILPRTGPDGLRLAFTSNRDGNFEVYTMNVDGSNVTRLTIRPATDDFSLDWKGDKILFVSQTNDISQIWLMNSNGTGQTFISGDLDVDGAISPDLTRIVVARVTSNMNSRGQLVLETIGGANFQNITNTSNVFNRLPDWSN